MFLTRILAILSLAVALNVEAAVVTSDDLDAAFKTIQKLNPQTDFAQVKPIAVKVWAIAQQLTADPAPEGAVEKENWQKRMTWVKEVQVYTEYVVGVAALSAPPALTVDLVPLLEFHNPKSKYLDSVYGRYLVCLNQTGSAAKIPAVAEKALAHHPENEDLLLVAADNAYATKQTNNALTYSRRLTSVLSKHGKPEGMSAADWEKKRSAALGRGYWISGIITGERNQYIESDRDLRAALPFVKGNDAMAAAAYYYLGLANYQLGKMTMNKALVLEAVKFSETASRYNSAFSSNASHNAQVMRQEAAGMR